RYVGEGVISSVQNNRLIDLSATFPVPSGSRSGLRRLWLQPDKINPAYFWILNNDGNSLTVYDDGTFSSSATAGDTYTGVVLLRSVTVRGATVVDSGDP